MPRIPITPAVKPFYDRIKEMADVGNEEELIVAVIACYWAGYNRCALEVEAESKELPDTIPLN